ncbi:peptide ABC transporter permease [Arthrobacter sp. MYb224]|uniref:ABC transporter permease n=1 Tax=unclassified Arthrobacter TaxID=235627 RepID=UPI000CFCAF0B|nr:MULTISPECIES: ABC transporter permease [unclassified Arthrobacter]PRA00311.1 peptide ABC transporter permease [Arthrobacter sp. MYb224]PRA04502.1 peptide ABC transporter permease [Arthrobacter sp. MYb229]PRB51585.1 peptide ABC transporter permease [Arthrobacter sp. MYb216]
MAAEQVLVEKTRRKLSLTLIVGGSLVAVVVLAALVSFFWTPYNPVQAFPADRLQGSSAAHLMGTDRYGRDVFSGVLYGARITLLVGLVAVGIALVIGTPLGILAGMRGGITEEVTMRGADILLAFPALLVAIMFGAVFGASTLTAMLAIGIGSIPGFARVARSGTLQVMSTEYIMAAKASSQSGWRIARRHVMPNIVGMVVVQCSVSFAIAVLAEAALSFLGLGTPPPVPSWGRMLQESQQFLGTFPMLAVWPGAAIAVAVLGFTLLGDGLRDRFDPKLNGER